MTATPCVCLSIDRAMQYVGDKEAVFSLLGTLVQSLQNDLPRIQERLDAGDLLPAELGEILARLRSDAHPMPMSQLVAVLDSHWGEGWDRHFERFSFTPMAAASIAASPPPSMPPSGTLTPESAGSTSSPSSEQPASTRHPNSGAASTAFWVDPVDDLTVTFFTQLLPSSVHPIRSQLKQLVYQSMLD